MRLFKKAAIIGTGLIGGSLALALKRKGIAAQVVGVSRKKSTLLSAKKIGAIDAGSQKLRLIKGADLVVFAAPPEAISALALQASRFIGRGCIVIDVGSTKEKITAGLDKIFPNYVGTHPLAGSEKRGVLNADAQMFEGSLSVLTPTKKTSPAALKKVALLWKLAGAKTVCLPARLHDKILAFTSHLPHAIAFSLIASIPAGYLKFSSTGLRDTTRVAASDSEVWEQILLSNRRHILEALRVFQARLSKLASAIEKQDRRALSSTLRQARKKRNSL